MVWHDYKFLGTIYDTGKWKCQWKLYSINLNFLKCQGSDVIYVGSKVFPKDADADPVLVQLKG